MVLRQVPERQGFNPFAMTAFHCLREQYLVLLQCFLTPKMGRYARLSALERIGGLMSNELQKQTTAFIFSTIFSTIAAHFPILSHSLKSVFDSY